MNIEEIKNFLKIEHSEDDTFLTLLKETSEAYLKGAIEIDLEETILTDKRFIYAQALLISHWYENRNGTSEAELKPIPFGIISFIQQLRGR
jgi:uncharacterized phage protein (predicted DNA packaging)